MSVIIMNFWPRPVALWRRSEIVQEGCNRTTKIIEDILRRKVAKV